MKSTTKIKDRGKQNNDNKLYMTKIKDNNECFSDQALYSNDDSDDELSNLSKSTLFNTESFLSDHLLKYDNFRSIIEKVMPDEIMKIESIVDNIYDSCLDIYEREDDENCEEYSFSYFNFIEEVSELKLDKRNDNDIIKLMYLLSYHLGKVIEVHKERFYQNYSNHENLKAKLYNEMSTEYNNLLQKLSNNFPDIYKKSNPTTKKPSDQKENLNTNDINLANNYKKLFMYPLKAYHFQNKEYAFINKIPKESCYSILDDLYTSYDFISKFLELVCNNFSNLIIRYNMIIGEEKNIQKIFIEEFSSSVIEDPFFKVSHNIL